MMRLIDADRLDDKLRENDWAGNYPPLDEISDIIDDQPTVDAEPVRHGHWIPCSGKSHIYYCSACGGKISYNQARRTYKPINNQAVYEEHKFCRHCGAKMGEEVDRGEE